MCTLMDKAEAVHHACLPNSWWQFATTHATHIYNRTPLSCLQWHTPYEALHSTQPQIDHLHIFGCTAYVFLLADIRVDKLTPKLELMVYLDVAPGNDANFLFMHSPNNVLFTPAQAEFSEVQFPKCDKPVKRPGHRSLLTYLQSSPLRHRYHLLRILLHHALHLQTHIL